MVRGFFADVIGRLGVPGLADRLTAAIEAELGRWAVSEQGERT